MKLGKTAWIFLASGIFVVLFTSLIVAYSQQVQEQNRLYQELSSVRLTLDKYSAKFSPERFSSQQRELESRLAQAQSGLEDVKARLRQSIESIEVTDTLFEVARTCDVKIIEIRSSRLTSGELEGVTFSDLPLRATVEGDVPNLIKFILELSGKFPTSMAESVEINVPELTEGGETGEELEKPSANLKLHIYTYEGD